MGGENGGGAEKKEGELPGAGGGVLEERVEDQVHGSGGGQSEIHQPGCRKSLQMAMVEVGRAVGAVACHLDTGRA